jgi:Tfp pilus assembly protein PilW
MMSSARLRDQRGMMLMELLIAMVIATIITSFLLVSWFALQTSYSRSVKSAESRETARDAVARMTREIRDAAANAGDPTFFVAKPSQIVFTTPFNDANGANMRIMYQLVGGGAGEGGRIVRGSDDNGNDVIDPGERQIVIAGNVVNGSTPVFTYTYANPDGSIATASSLTSTQLYQVKILNVQIHVMIDLNPGQSPNYMDLISTAQPRNLRNF